MAKFKSNKEKAADLLPDIVKATKEGGFLHVPSKLAEILVGDGLAETNPAIINEAGEIATRATEKGITEVMSEETKTAGEVQGFVIETGIEPPVGRRSGGRVSKYPFDALEVNQSFFIPGGDVKALGSTVSSANARYAVPALNDDGSPKMKTYKVKGEEKTKQASVKTRVFKVGEVEGGARIWRVK